MLPQLLSYALDCSLIHTLQQLYDSECLKHISNSHLFSRTDPSEHSESIRISVPQETPRHGLSCIHV